MKVFQVLAVVAALGAGPALAGVPHLAAGAGDGLPGLEEMTAGDYPVKPSEAALIAQKTVPGSKALNVKLLPSGEYVVTLKAGGNVQKVMVNATTGATS